MKRLITVFTLMFVAAGLLATGVFADDDAEDVTERGRVFRFMHRNTTKLVCEDADEDGLCDRCGEAFVDKDGDGRCDTCVAGRGTGNGGGFVDEDGDGVCDNGGGTGFVDEDGDGVCDNCANQAGSGRKSGRGRGGNGKRR